MPSLEALVRRAGLAAERWYREMQRPLTDLPDRATGRPASSSCRSPGTATTRSGGRTTPPSPGTTAPPSGTPRPGGRCSPASAASAPTCPAWRSRTAPSSGTCSPTSTRPTPPRAGTREVVLGQIGVLPQARGRGVATALIAEVLRAAARAGLPGRGARRRHRERDRGAPAVRGGSASGPSGRGSPGRCDLPPVAARAGIGSPRLRPWTVGGRTRSTSRQTSSSCSWSGSSRSIRVAQTVSADWPRRSPAARTRAAKPSSRSRSRRSIRPSV